MAISDFEAAMIINLNEKKAQCKARSQQPNPNCNICGQIFKNNPFLACIIPQETSASKGDTLGRALTSYQCGRDQIPASTPFEG